MDPVNATQIRTLIVISLCCTLFSCGKDDDAKPAANTATFLKVGTKYTLYYDDNLFNADTIKVVVEKQLATDTFLVRNYSESIEALVPTQYWVLKDNNFYTSFRLRDPSTYQIECKFGKPVGTSWEVVKNKIKYTYSIEELNVPITTGDGVVKDAIKIKMRSPSGSEYVQYISPTVGMLGNGSVNENVTAKLVHYTIGQTSTTTNTIPHITYGDFTFLKVANYWNYQESSWAGDVDVSLLVESKVQSKNIYKVKMTYDGATSYSYWYEDRGFLMVYEEGETVLNADPVYMSESIATTGYGWAGVTLAGTTFFYRVGNLNTLVDTYFGLLPSMEIEVTDGLFSSQMNYWNKTKGNVLVTGSVSRDVVGSNARGKKSTPMIPIISM